MGQTELAVKTLARRMGFDLVGIASAEPFLRDEEAAVQRVRGGLMDGLPWYTEERVRKATHPEKLLPGARSIVSLAMSYFTGDPKPGADNAARQDCALRLGRRLPRRHEEATSPVRRCAPGGGRQAGQDPHIRRRRAHERPRGRRARRGRLVRQEHQHPDAEPRLMGAARPGHNGPRPEAGPSPG